MFNLDYDTPESAQIGELDGELSSDDGCRCDENPNGCQCTFPGECMGPGGCCQKKTDADEIPSTAPNAPTTKDRGCCQSKADGEAEEECGCGCGPDGCACGSNCSCGPGADYEPE